MRRGDWGAPVRVELFRVKYAEFTQNPKGEKRIQAFITQFVWCEWMVASHEMATRTEKINRFRRLSILLTVSRRPSEIAVGAVGRGERRVHGDHFVAGTIANSIVTATSRLGGRSLD
jgi:hypothetical protein